MFKHLLVPTDGTELSRQTVHQAVVFARESGARITFFYATPDHPVSFFGNVGLTDPQTRENLIKSAEHQAQEILAAAIDTAKAAGVDCVGVTNPSENPHDAIIAAAQAHGCDLIFMASHGRRGISGLLLGSETHKVLTHSRIPVLVYR